MVSVNSFECLGPECPFYKMLGGEACGVVSALAGGNCEATDPNYQELMEQQLMAQSRVDDGLSGTWEGQ